MEKPLQQLLDSAAAADDLESLTRPILEWLETVTGMESTYLTTIDHLAGLQHILFARNTRKMQIPRRACPSPGETRCSWFTSRGS